jgi:hypothetical protein
MKKQKHLALKILLALFPAIILLQNYSWMTANNKVGISFLLIWGLLLWSVWRFEDKDLIFERYFRLSEIAFFLLPVSAIILTFVLGSQAINSSTNDFEQAGMAIGTAIGGTFIVIISFIIGIVGGIVMHLITKKYDKKVENHNKDFASKHGIIMVIVGLFLLAIILGNVKDKEGINESNKTLNGNQNNSVNEEVSKENEVEIKILEKDFFEGDFSDQITMNLEFTNKIDKDVKGVEGVLSLYDIFDKKIKTIKVAYDKMIPKNSAKIWETGVGYNQFMDEDIKLKDTELENLNYKWEVNKIVYNDEFNWQVSENDKVNLIIEKKGIFEGDFSDQITMNFKFTNNTDKDIKGVDGVITFYDIFDNEIKKLNISYDKGITVDTPKTWEAGFDYNQFMDEDIKLKNTDLENLKYKWKINTIVFDDGSKEDY